MVIRHAVITLTGSAQSLTGLGLNDICRQVYLQADPANSHVAYVGSYNDTLTSSSYGYIMPIPTSSIPVRPISFEGPIQIESIAVLGTNGEKIHILTVA